jgi:two-component system, sensor histidine kinase and response regulator
MSETVLSQTDATGGRVLVIDDTARNRNLLIDLLTRHGYQVTAAPDGEQGLREVESSRPDVILLDVVMPGMSGIEVCKRLKNNPQTAKIQILMLSAVAGRPERLAAINAGANDFLNQPVDMDEVALRVRNAALTKRLVDHLERSCQELRKLEDLRDDLNNMMIHDLKSPIFGITGYCELLKMEVEKRPGGGDLMCYVDEIVSSARELTEMVRTLLDTNRLDTGRMTLNRVPGDLGQLLGEALEIVRGREKTKPLRLAVPPEPVTVACEADLVRRVAVKLVSLALKFARCTDGVGVRLERDGANARVAIDAEGFEVPPAYRRSIFEKFGGVEAAREGKIPAVGLNLPFCRLAVEAHGGTISLEGEPCRFLVTLPLAP